MPEWTNAYNSSQTKYVSRNRKLGHLCAQNEFSIIGSRKQTSHICTLEDKQTQDLNYSSKDKPMNDYSMHPDYLQARQQLVHDAVVNEIPAIPHLEAMRM